LNFLFIILGIIILGSLVLYWADWFTHIHMVKGICPTYGWTSYKIFKEKFDATDWDKIDLKYSTGVFKEDKDLHVVSKVFSNIIIFNDIGMIMRTPIEYAKAKLYTRKYIKKYYVKPVSKHRWR